MTTIKTRTLKNGIIKTYQYETNKEYNTKYYTENKDKILKTIVCECGGRYHSLNKSRHFQRKKHIDFFK